MKVVVSDGAELRYEHMPRPGAPAMLFINSLGASLEMWDDQTDELCEHFECVRYDARGHGKSTAGSRDELSLDVLAQDAIAVLDACGIARAHLCGISLGGMTAMTIAQQWPDRVLKLVLSNTSAYMPPRDAWQTRIESVRATGLASAAQAAIERWFTAEFRSAHLDKVERIRELFLATDPRGYAACATAIRDMDLRESIKSITARTLVVTGSQDPATPPQHGEFIAAHIEGAKLVTLDSAHLSNIERAEEFNAALSDFLAAKV